MSRTELFKNWHRLCSTITLLQQIYLGVAWEKSPKAALLLWFFGDFRCGALLFVVIHVIYKYKNR